MARERCLGERADARDVSGVVAIDGPGGSGKSTVARALAATLQIPHVDTGASYRALTLAALRAGLDLHDEDALVALAARTHLAWRDGRTLLDGRDVTGDIRSADVDRAVSAVARHPGVRARLVGVQRSQVTRDGAVVEGRDAGTVVVPSAVLKVWLTADVTERARRRAAQLGEVGEEAVQRHRRELERRDDADAGQMRRAADVVEVDTTDQALEETVQALVDLRCARMGA